MKLMHKIKTMTLKEIILAVLIFAGTYCLMEYFPSIVRAIISLFTKK
ncbi:MAG: hypothetical protein JWQ78_699 [Sediminibacterium sp.]|nr:hypothetical protein [Sediminibacterium sp.]